VGIAACDRPPRPAPAAGAAALPQETPLQVVEQLIAARQSGTYQPLNDLIVPEQVHEVVRTLVAVDEFLMENDALCAYVRERFTLGLSQSIDQSRWAKQLGVFSKYVEVLEQQVDGLHATVSYKVDGQLPVGRAELVRIDGRWRYDAGPGYDPQLPAAFQRMAQGLRLVLDDLKSGRLAEDTIRAQPERLLEEVRIRLLPGIKLFPSAPATRPGGG
jgi:hypothetical protein